MQRQADDISRDWVARFRRDACCRRRRRQRAADTIEQPEVILLRRRLRCGDVRFRSVRGVGLPASHSDAKGRRQPGCHEQFQ